MTYDEINECVRKDPSRLCGGWKRRANGKWANSRHVTREGSPEAKGKQGSYILANMNCVFDGATNEPESFIAFFARTRGLPFSSGTFSPAQWEANKRAWQALAELYGGSLTLDEKAEQRARQRAERLSLVETIYKNSRNNWKSPQVGEEARVSAVKQYFKKRGWTEAEAEAAGIGVLSLPDAALLKEDEEYAAVIPIRSFGKLIDIKIRTVSETTASKSKYRNLKGAELSSFAYLTPHLSGLGEAYLAEGELDALRVQVKAGLPCFAARGGANMASEERMKELKAAGWRSLVILADSDEQGLAYAVDAALAAEKIGLDAKIATLSGAKDADEYLSKHTAEEFRAALSAARPASTIAAEHLLDNIGSSYEDFYVDAEALYLAVKPHLRKGLEDALSAADDKLQGHFHTYAADVIEELRAKAKEEADAEAKERRAEAAKKLSKAAELTAKGESRKAQELIAQAESLTAASSETEQELIKKLFDTSTAREVMAEAGNVEGIPTNYFFGETGGKYENWFDRLILPKSAITVISALPSHCKSSMLFNLTLAALDFEKESQVLYLSTELNEWRVQNYLIRLLYRRLAGADNDLSESNIETIASYLLGETKYIKNYSLFDKRVESLEAAIKEYDKLKADGRLLVKYLSTAEEAVETIRIRREYGRPISAIFVDYVQKVTCAKGETPVANLTNACGMLREAAEDAALIEASQIVRGVCSPTEFRPQSNSDGSIIEKDANTNIALWLGKTAPAKDHWNSEGLAEQTILNAGFAFKPGLLYATNMKSRDGRANGFCILRHEGNSGLITDLKAEKMKGNTTESKTSFETEECPF